MGLSSRRALMNVLCGLAGVIGSIAVADLIVFRLLLQYQFAASNKYVFLAVAFVALLPISYLTLRNLVVPKLSEYGGWLSASLMVISLAIGIAARNRLPVVPDTDLHTLIVTATGSKNENSQGALVLVRYLIAGNTTIATFKDFVVDPDWRLRPHRDYYYSDGASGPSSLRWHGALPPSVDPRHVRIQLVAGMHYGVAKLNWDGVEETVDLGQIAAPAGILLEQSLPGVPLRNPAHIFHALTAIIAIGSLMLILFAWLDLFSTRLNARVLLTGFLLFMLPVLLLTYSMIPYYDDYGASMKAQETGLFGFCRHYWSTWQGRFSSHMMLYFSVRTMDLVHFHWLRAVVLLVVGFGLICLAVKRLNPKSDDNGLGVIHVTSILFTLYIVLVPTINELVYWPDCGAQYVAAAALALVLISLLLAELPESSRDQIIRMIGIGVLTFFVVGTTEPLMMVLMSALGLLWLVNLKIKSPRTKYFLVALIGGVLGTLLMVLAPGNRTRLNAYDSKVTIFEVITYSRKDIVRLFTEWGLSFSLLSATVILLPWLRGIADRLGKWLPEDTGKKFVFWIPIWGLLISFSQPVLSYYSANFYLGRTQSTLLFTFLFTWFTLPVFVFLGWPKLRGYVPVSRPTYVAAISIFVVSIHFGLIDKRVWPEAFAPKTRALGDETRNRHKLAAYCAEHSIYQPVFPQYVNTSSILFNGFHLGDPGPPIGTKLFGNYFGYPNDPGFARDSSDDGEVLTTFFAAGESRLWADDPRVGKLGVIRPKGNLDRNSIISSFEVMAGRRYFVSTLLGDTTSQEKMLLSWRGKKGGARDLTMLLSEYRKKHRQCMVFNFEEDGSVEIRWNGSQMSNAEDYLQQIAIYDVEPFHCTELVSDYLQKITTH